MWCDCAEIELFRVMNLSSVLTIVLATSQLKPSFFSSKWLKMTLLLQLSLMTLLLKHRNYCLLKSHTKILRCIWFHFCLEIDNYKKQFFAGSIELNCKVKVNKIKVNSRDARIPFLISVSYPYPLKTIRILSIQTLITDICILSVSVVLLWYNMTPWVTHIVRNRCSHLN